MESVAPPVLHRILCWRDGETNTLCQYNVPVKVGMSLSVLASARKMSDRQSKEETVVQLQK